MKHQLSSDLLDDLVDLWHEGAWPDSELEDVIREATNWSHEDFDRWAATGAQPGDASVFVEQNWCGHDKEANPR